MNRFISISRFFAFLVVFLISGNALVGSANADRWVARPKVNPIPMGFVLRNVPGCTVATREYTSPKGLSTVATFVTKDSEQWCTNFAVNATLKDGDEFVSIKASSRLTVRGNYVAIARGQGQIMWADHLMGICNNDYTTNQVHLFRSRTEGKLRSYHTTWRTMCAVPSGVNK